MRGKSSQILPQRETDWRKALPDTMNAMEIVGSDGHFRLAPTRRNMPQPGADEVLISVKASGVNGHDVHHIHRGSHPLREGETDIPGLEVAGTIAAIGENVDEWSVGDEVCALLRGGGYAEFAKTPAGNCLPKPANLSWVEAAVLPETYFTVWSNVFVDSGLAPGETLLMNGGTSGIGVAAIQIANSLGCTVFATARGPEKTKLCEALGAARGIDYLSEDFADVVMAETDGRGADVIFDIVAGDYVPRDLEAAAHGGRIVFIGGARGFESTVNIRTLMHKQLRLGGSLLRPRSDEYKRRVRDELRERVWPQVEAGKIKPMLDRAFPLAEANDAIAVLESRQQIGKVALIVSEE